MSVKEAKAGVGVGSLVSIVWRKRLAQIPERRFVLEADIDSERTHVMVRDRFDEYVEHALPKRSRSARLTDIDALRPEIRKEINQGRRILAPYSPLTRGGL